MFTVRRTALTCLLLYAFSQLAFLINIQFPRGYNFDEFHYVPTAKQFLELKVNRNWEHPPLAKELMAVGIAIGGDRPFGWRLMSTVFGALTLVGMYLWGLALFRDQRTALWVAALTLFNQLLYVQARIGMLDTFMMGFLAFAMASFSALWRSGLKPHQLRRLLYFCGAMLGFATAAKWFGVIALAYCIGLVALIRLFQLWNVRFVNPQPQDWYRADLWRGLHFRDWLIGLGLIPLLAYFITFVPYLFMKEGSHGLWDLVLMQKQMWEGQGRVVSSHPYMSTMTDWPLLSRPIWYAFDKEGPVQEFVRGVLLLGNPWIMWTGLVAIVFCGWSFIVERRKEAFLILTSYLAFYFCWAIIPRKVSFYYYYYPAGMVLSLAVADALRKRPSWNRWAYLAVSAGVFAYFFPILAALRIPAEKFRDWMWFRSWI